MKAYLTLHIQEFSGSKLVDVDAGLRHSTAVTGLIDNTVWLCLKNVCYVSESLENGMVYSWGDDKKGQLGHGRTGLNVQPTPKCG